MRHQINSQKLAVEQLEDRTVLSGTVTAQLAGGVLTLTGDANANAIRVFQTGTTLAGATVTVAGNYTPISVAGKLSGFKTFTGVTDIKVSLGAGNDSLVFTNTKLSGGVDIVMGAGSDVLQMSNIQAQGTEKLNNQFGIFIDMADSGNNNIGDGNDIAMLGNVSMTTNGFKILAGPGSDFVGLNAVKVPTTGGGNAQTLLVETGSGKGDRVTLVNCTAGNAIFDFGNLLNNGSTITPGTNGALSGSGNNITTQTIDFVGSTSHSGDLVSNKV
jgi:hypothetical protein